MSSVSCSTTTAEIGFLFVLGATSCACVILAVCSNEAGTLSHTHTQSRMHRTHTHSLRLRHSTLTRAHKHVHALYRHVLCMGSTDGPPHNTNTLSILGCHTHARSRLRNVLVHSHFPNKSRPAVVRTSCDWSVLSVCMSAHILTRLRASTVSGINSVCVCVCTVCQHIVLSAL